MLASASNSISVDAIPVSRQENHCPAISGKIDLLKEKLNAIEPNKTTHEIRCLTDFIEKNETKMRDITAISDKLLTALSVVNSIKDNIAMGEDNTENLSQLNNLIREMEDMLRPDERKDLGERFKTELKRSTGKVADEGNRFINKATNEVEKTIDKTKKEIKRVWKRF